MSEITEGSTVSLKSGGPMMTVKYLTAGPYADEQSPKDKAHCIWFSPKGEKPHEDTFPLTALVLEED